MAPIKWIFSLASLILFTAPALAGFSSSSSTNVAIYWGQNSLGQGTGPNAQQRLSYYCANTEFNIVPIAFLTTISNPTLNFANAGNNCTAITGSSLFYCPQIEQDIQTCQQTYGKSILLSVGGSTYTEGGFSSSALATAAANNIWTIFGPQTSNTSIPRPFGSAVIDGFDFDFESTVSNMIPFGQTLRSLMNTAQSSTGGKPYFLTAAPQCPYPDAADGPMLAGAVYFDAIWIQFYNNYCGLQSYTPSTGTTQNNFNFATWDNWAKTVSLNPNVKVFLGVPGSSTAAGSGYESGSTLGQIIAYSKSFSSFGGVMIWDASQVFANAGFLDSAVGYLGQAPQTTFSTSTVSSTSSAAASTTVTGSGTGTPTTSSAAASSTGPGLVNQWNQCAGQGWTGGTVCKPPYTCVYLSVWYSQCE
ncbi:hypothetical protein G7Y89_g12445 [Cudoniella acicularis]|uniref:chitinase n=1 Tax=Cudoniella acicularis TaxID=354080 RepID=A0A8H4RBT8_9HELO|nr:hypothetical protein G7Y89_g12445 [Cudoniella acicularis]